MSQISATLTGALADSHSWRDSEEAPISFLVESSTGRVVATVSRHGEFWEAETNGRRLGGKPGRPEAKRFAEEAVPVPAPGHRA